MKGTLTELSRENLTVDEVVAIARRVPNHRVLVQALKNHPNINFEYIEISVSARGFKVTRPIE